MLDVRFFVRRLFMPRFLPARLFAPRFGASFPLRLTARYLDAAEAAAEVFDFTFIVQLLVFGKFNELQNVFHLLEGIFEGRDNGPHLFGGLGNGRKFFLRRSLRPANGRARHVRPFDRRRLDGRRFGWTLLRRPYGGFSRLRGFACSMGGRRRR